MISSTLQCGWSVVNISKIDDFQVFMLIPCWVSFWRCFGSPNGGQSHQKAISKKTPKKWCPTWAQTGPKGVPKMEPKSSKVRSWKHLVSRVAPKRPPEPLQDRFWRGFGTILEPFSAIFLAYFCDFCMHSLAACCKQKRSKSQGITKRMQQRASKRQLLASCHLALKSSVANVNELSGPC